MCGIVGVATQLGRPLSVTDEKVIQMRDLLTHRGKDDAGLWRDQHIAIGHRRLAIVDQKNGQQPWVLDEGVNVKVLSYNGQLYNWRVLRQELQNLGVEFYTQCDTEVVARALEQWGIKALSRFRGMFAVAWYNAELNQFILARDPLGIKPLYYALVPVKEGKELVFASEPYGVISHPALAVKPDWVTVSAYLTTIRTTLARRTLFENVCTLQPGEIAVCDLNSPALTLSFEQILLPSMGVDGDFDAVSLELHQLIEESVDLHLMGDDPPSAFLSGGLDSSIIVRCASRRIDGLNSFCATTPEDQLGDGGYSQLMADFLGVQHARVDIDQAQFHELWPWMIQGLGVPLSTPNEVGILSISAAASQYSKVVLSGEGADELFGGYRPPLTAYADYLEQNPRPSAENLVATYLGSVSWIATTVKDLLLAPDIYPLIEEDRSLYEHLAEVLAPDGGADPTLRTFLNAQQRFNLTGLLGRLDTATMLAGIEGRTPFSDAVIASYSRQLPMDYLFRVSGDDSQTKRILRSSFAKELPDQVVYRPKASFPLPFQQWMQQRSQWLTEFNVVNEVFQSEVLNDLSQDLNAHWMAGWPILNIAYWLEWHWGNRDMTLTG